MSRLANEPLVKVTLNLFQSDVEWLKDQYDQGYTEQIRNLVRRYIRAREKTHQAIEDDLL